MLIAENIIGTTPEGNPVYALRGGRGFEFLVTDDDGPDDEPRGRAGDVDDEDDEDDEPRGRAGSDGDDEDDEDDEDDGAPQSPEEYARMRRELARVKAESARRRILLRQHGINPTTGKPTGRMPAAAADDRQGALFGSDDDGYDRDLARAAARAQAETESAYQAVLVRAGLTAALREAGWNGGGKPLISRLVDLDQIDVDIDEQGEPVFDGLDEQIEQIREEFPQWFRGKPARGRRAVSSAQAPLRGAGAVDGGRTTGRGQQVASKGWRSALDARIAGTAKRSR